MPAMNKQPRVDEPDGAAPEAERKWYWFLTANGAWSWAYHAAYRSQQLATNSEAAVGRDVENACMRLDPGMPASPERKRKRDASP